DDGSITIQTSNNTDYQYTWSPNVSSTNSAKGLMAGIYTVTISYVDDPECSIVRTITVGNSDGPEATASTTAANCQASNGTAVLSPAGLTYTWEDGFVGNSRTDLKAQSYRVTVEDGSGCSNVLTININENNDLIALVNIDRQPDCGQANGQVSLSVGNGSGTYEYSWGSSNVRSDLLAGVYSVMITDVESGCFTAVNFALTDNVSGVSISGVTDTKVSCAGASDGAVSFQVTPDVGVRIEIRDANNNTFTNGALAPGDYCVLAIDIDNCIAGQACFTVEDALSVQLDVALTDQDCEADGSILLGASGGSGNYRYDWLDLSGDNDPKDRTDLEAGSYSVTVYDSNGCSASAELLIENNCDNTSDCKADAGSLSANEPTVCQENGFATITASPAGGLNVPAGFNVAYVLTRGEELVIERISQTPTFVVSGLGRYTIHTLVYNPVTINPALIDLGVATGFDVNALLEQGGGDICGALDVTGAVFNITECGDCVPPVINGIDATVAGCELANAQATVNVDNAAAYSFSWSAGFANGNTVSGLAAGAYTVTVAETANPECFTVQAFIISDDCDGTGVTPDTIPLILMVNTNAEICVPMSDGFLRENSSFSLLDGSLNGSSAFGSWTLDANTGCLNYTASGTSGTNVDLVCVRILSNGQEDVVCVRVSITPEGNCESIVDDTEVVIPVGDCNNEATYCLDIPLEEIFNYTITDNNVPYAGGLAPCGVGANFSYSYFLIPGGGEAGPYTVESWTVGNNTFTGAVADVDALVDSMNVWDPAGSWVKDAATLRIIGGSGNTNYGAIRIQQNATNQVGILNLNDGTNITGTQVTLTSGKHQLIITEISTGCKDTVDVIVECDDNNECGTIYSGPAEVSIDDCDAVAGICLDIDPTTILQYVITNNGSPYEAGFNGCEFKTVVSYLYFTIPDRGEDG
ncbi:MAG: hypothetical protein AAFO94_08030, partial [Bacteroidota bacterium]